MFMHYFRIVILFHNVQSIVHSTLKSYMYIRWILDFKYTILLLAKLGKKQYFDGGHFGVTL